MGMVKTQRGFSVIELLIALGLGLLVVAGVIQLFVGNSRTYDLVNAQSRLQENARFAFDFIGRSARSAGFFGCAPDQTKVAFNLTGAVGGVLNVIPEYNVTEPVDGWDSNGNGSYAPDNLTTLPRSSGGVNTMVHIDGNGIDRERLAPEADLLVLRAAEQPIARLAQTLQPTGNPIVATPGGQPQFKADDVLIVADCEQAALFLATETSYVGDETLILRTTSTSGNPFVNSPTITTPVGDVVPSSLSIVSRSYGSEATIARVRSDFFFVAESTDSPTFDDPDAQGQRINALWMKSGAEAPREMVQGIEDMQILYGVDTTNDGALNVNQYLEIDKVDNVREIVALRVTLRVTSVDSLAELGNERLQRTFTKTIFVRNMG